jgi:hypothetical protein
MDAACPVCASALSTPRVKGPLRAEAAPKAQSPKEGGSGPSGAPPCTHLHRITRRRAHDTLGVSAAYAGPVGRMGGSVGARAVLGRHIAAPLQRSGPKLGRALWVGPKAHAPHHAPGLPIHSPRLEHGLPSTIHARRARAQQPCACRRERGTRGRTARQAPGCPPLAARMRGLQLAGSASQQAPCSSPQPELDGDP